MAVDAGELKVSVESPAAWARRLTITVPAERVARERKQAAERLARRVKLPGFRKGKVPAHVMEKRFGQAIDQELVERLVGDAYREAVKREGLQPITQGAVEGIDYAAGADLTFSVDLEVRPEIELNRLGGFNILRQVHPVDDTAVEQVLERLRSEQAVWRPVEEGQPVAGDMVVVEITPLTEGAERPDPRRYQIVLGEGQAAAPIEDVIRTLQPGQDIETTVDLPENAEEPNSPLVPNRIHVRLVEAKRPELPQLDDEFARGLGDFSGLDELRARVREDMEREARQEAERRVHQDLTQNVVDANPFDVPQSMVNEYLGRLLPSQEGIDPAKLAEYRESVRPAAEQALRRMIVVERVAELEALHATPDEVEARIAAIAERAGRSAAEVRGQLQKGGRIREIQDEITESKVFDYLKSLSTIS